MTAREKRRIGPRPAVFGSGERVVLVHGSVATGSESWEGQLPLAEEGFELVVPDRRGYGARAAEVVGEDYQHDAEDIVQLLGSGAHLVGHSYGAIGALFAAAVRPEVVRSLVVIEPPAFALAADHPAVATLVRASEALWTRPGLDDRAFLEEFLATIGVPHHEVPDDLLEHWVSQTAPLRGCRPPWSARIPVGVLARAAFPKLVVSGGHHTAFDATCVALAGWISARLVVVAGAGHEVQSTGEPFNEVLRTFWAASERRQNP